MSIRALSFEKLYPQLDADYNTSEAHTYADILTGLNLNGAHNGSVGDLPIEIEPEVVDAKEHWEQQAIEAFKEDTKLMERLEAEQGIAWGSIKAKFLEVLPDHIDGRDQLAYYLVSKAMDQLFGDEMWESYKNERGTTYVRAKC